MKLARLIHGKVTTHTLPFAKLDAVQVDLSTGDIEEIGFNPEVYGDTEHDEFGTVIAFCDASPSGQCVYSITDHFQRCIYCKQGDGV